MRGTIVVAIVVGGGCYHPNAATGVPCAANGECPNGQRCDVTRSPPICVGSGAAGAPDAAYLDAAIRCTDSSTCEPAAPICDAATHTCRGCAADVECPGGVCTEYTGECVADADTIYVSANGADAGTCTSASACATFAYALMQLTATRRTIRAGDGAYPSTALTISDSGGRIVISGERLDFANGAVLAASGSLLPPIVNAQQGTDVVIEGVTINNTGGDGVSYGGAMLLSHVQLANTNGTAIRTNASNAAMSLTMSRCLIEAGNNGLNVQAGTVALDRTRFDHINGNGIQISQANVTIVNCIVANSKSPAVQLQNENGHVAKILFTTIAETQGNPSVKMDQGGELLDSIVVAPPGNQTFQCNTNCVVAYSLFSDVVPIGLDNIVGDPLFANAASGDFHISAGSPANDTADPNANVHVDFDGNPRPLGAGYDMGAYEIP